MSHAARPGQSIAPSHVYYDADVSKEEKERIEMLDQVNIQAYNLMKKPAYGLVQLNQKYEQ